jgi:TP901 family phage tail tape measure protein
MGIAADALGKFTEVVAKFTATTGVSVEQTSLAFGRMANLLPDIDSSRFDELGSSIAFVGVKSVATEGEIISVGRQISAISASAGLTADQVVGLSSAIASLGLAPEESRGALVRTFGEIRKAISSGSERLQQFASISNMTVDDFVDSWGRDAGGTFQQFIKGLSTVDIVKALQSVGLESIRTTRFLTSLGDNYELVFKQMALASEGMSNSYLDKTFATTVDDIIVRIELLNQSVQNLLASSTSSAPILQVIGSIVDGLKAIVVAITELNKNPVSAFISTLAISLVGLVGVIIGVVGAAALFRASFLAMRTAALGLMSIQGMPAWASGVIGSLAGVSGAATTATVATKTLTIAMTAMKIAVPALLAISLIAGVVASELGKAEKQAEKTRKAFANFEGIEDALKKDTEAVKQGERFQAKYVAETQNMTKQQESAIREGRNLSSVFKELKKDSEDAAESALTSAGYYGEATAEFIKGRMSTSQEFKDLLGRDDFSAYWNAIDADIDVFVQEIIPQGREGIQRYFSELTLEAQKQGKEIPALLSLDFFDAAFSGISGSGAKTALTEFIDLTGGVTGEIQKTVNATDILSGSAGNASRNLRIMTDELIKLALASAGVSEESLVVEDALFALGRTLTENGEDFDEFSEKGRQNIRAVGSVVSALAKDADGDMSVFVQSVEGLIASLIEQGYGGSAVVQMLRNSIAELTDDAGNPIEFDINFKLNVQAFMEGIKKVEEGTKRSAGRVQTALEKMVDRIQKAFQLLNRKIDANDALESLSESLIENGRNFSIYSKQGRDNLQSVQDAIDSLAQRSDGNTRKFGQDLDALRRVLQNSGFRGSAAIKLINQAMKAAGTGAKATTKQVKQMAKELNGLNADRLLSIAKAADSMASRLSDLFNASIQGQRANLALAAGYEKLEEDVANARKEIEDTQRTIKGLVADRGILEYQLQIALKYGDTLRAEEIRAELDNINASITENQNKINQAEATLTGTSATAQLDRLDTLQTLAQNINVAFANLAVQGDMTRKELRAWVDEQTEMFVKSAIAAGASEEDAKKLADQIKKNLYDAIKKTPKLKVKTDDANKAVNALKANINSLKDKTVTITTVNRTINQAAMNPGMSIPQPGWQNFYSTGGFVSGPGSSTSDSIAARLSNGEYVVRASAVKHYGVDFMNALNSQAFQQRSFSSSTPQASLGEQLVYLSPEDRNLLRQAIDRPINLYTENTMIAKSANTGNVILAQRGQA